MTTTIITIPVEAVIDRLDHGKLWSKGWGDWQQSGAETCLHGAIRYCQPVKGDAYLIEQVGARFGFGTRANDDAGGWSDVETLVRSHADITDDMLAVTFGPQWELIVALVRRAAILTSDDATRLDAAWHAARAPTWDATRAAARAAARAATWAAAWAAAWDAAWDAARAPAWDATRAATRAAALALVTRDLIGQHRYTQQHYDTLTRPWAAVIGPVHPDDAPVMA
jgi:hypothetical protein